MESAEFVREGSAAAAAAPSSAIEGLSQITEMASRMAEDLGLPPSTVERKMGGLLRKLNLSP